VGRDGDTSFPEFHNSTVVSIPGARLCVFGAGSTSSLFPSLLLFPYTHFFRHSPLAYSFVFHSFLQPGAAVASLGASLCFLATPPLFVSVPVPGELLPVFVSGTDTISRLGIFFFPFFVFFCPVLSFVAILEGAELILLRLGDQCWLWTPRDRGCGNSWTDKAPPVISTSRHLDSAFHHIFETLGLDHRRHLLTRRPIDPIRFDSPCF
jgi:hypothetical protein